MIEASVEVFVLTICILAELATSSKVGIEELPFKSLTDFQEVFVSALFKF